MLLDWRWFRSLLFFLPDKLCASNIGLKFHTQIQHVLDMFALYSYLLKYYREKWWEQSGRTVTSFVWIVCGAGWLGEQLGLLGSLVVPTVGFVWVFPCQAVPSEPSPPLCTASRRLRSSMALSDLPVQKKYCLPTCSFVAPPLKPSKGRGELWVCFAYNLASPNVISTPGKSGI